MNKPDPHSTPLYYPRYWPSWAAVALLRTFSMLPLPLLWVLGALLGEVASRVPSRARHTADVNLALCFPDLDDAARRRLRRATFRAFMQAILSIGVGIWASRDRLRRLVRFRDRFIYDSALAAGQHVILLAPHFVVLEIAGLRLSQERPMVSMYKSPKNPVFDRVMRRGRSRFGGVMIERSSDLLPLVRLLREGRPFYYLPDQDPGGAPSVFAPFFGVPTATLTAPSRIARLARAAVIPCYTRLLPFGRGYEVIMKPPLPNFPSADPVADATCLNAAIEQAVREMPEQYLWTYKRFKSRPLNMPSRYD
ncbi:MAG: lysophospholipid acyltransferase family protein [Gammaproteobacteria bacterium]|nr:lysophospholipid acyltransferase family protein [Gammaproteobacteria bacterium]